jgi:predicted TIM-barrel fold metal-dependent hydrolase
VNEPVGDQGGDLDFGRFVDHHCHGLLADDLDREQFESAMSEADRRSPLATTVFDSMLGLSIRRWCAPILDLEPGVSPAGYLEQRRLLGAAEANRRLVSAAGIDVFLVDTGLWSAGLRLPADLAEMPSASTREVVRLETLAEEILSSGVQPEGFADEFEQRLRASRAVGAKSIAAYRVGLDLADAKPSADALVAALRSSRRPGASGNVRIAEPRIHAWLAWTAIDLGMPLQFHAGYGDSDLDLLACDPLRLTRFLRATQERGVPVMLLHNYPYHRQAAYLAQVFSHVFLDVGLALHNAGALSKHMLREVLELAPFGKVLFSSDAYALAELYLLGALLFRRGLTEIMTELVEQGELNNSDAVRVGSLIVRDNARRAYGLFDDRPPDGLR